MSPMRVPTGGQIFDISTSSDPVLRGVTIVVCPLIGLMKVAVQLAVTRDHPFLSLGDLGGVPQ
jgi:hypothetical protein